MNYYKARQLASGEGFHFTCRNDDRIWRVGYCVEHEPHATADEASACFARYLLDGWREESYRDWTGCSVCDKPTKQGLTTRPPLGAGFPLCDEHRTFEQLRELTPDSIEQIVASY